MSAFHETEVARLTEENERLQKDIDDADATGDLLVKENERLNALVETAEERAKAAEREVERFQEIASLSKQQMEAWKTSELALRDRLKQTEDALRRLRAEVHGALCLAEPELRQALGNTNVECIKLRLRNAEALLTPPPAEKEEPRS